MLMIGVIQIAQAFLIDNSGMAIHNVGNTSIQSSETLIIENSSEASLSELDRKSVV